MLNKPKFSQEEFDRIAKDYADKNKVINENLSRVGNVLADLQRFDATVKRLPQAAAKRYAEIIQTRNKMEDKLNEEFAALKQSVTDYELANSPIPQGSNIDTSTMGLDALLSAVGGPGDAKLAAESVQQDLEADMKDQLLGNEISPATSQNASDTAAPVESTPKTFAEIEREVDKLTPAVGEEAALPLGSLSKHLAEVTAQATGQNARETSVAGEASPHDDMDKLLDKLSAAVQGRGVDPLAARGALPSPRTENFTAASGTAAQLGESTSADMPPLNVKPTWMLKRAPKGQRLSPLPAQQQEASTGTTQQGGVTATSPLVLTQQPLPPVPPPSPMRTDVPRPAIPVNLPTKAPSKGGKEGGISRFLKRIGKGLKDEFFSPDLNQPSIFSPYQMPKDPPTTSGTSPKQPPRRPVYGDTENLPPAGTGNPPSVSSTRTSSGRSSLTSSGKNKT
jgi:uncharacterized protein YukE